MEHFRWGLVILLASLNVGSARAESGGFGTLTYNIAGLPELLSSAPSDREEATKIISCYINPFSVVNVQEDFNYHAALYNTCNQHAYRTATSGGAGFGSGLNTLSHLSFTDFERVRWTECSGVDCLTPKGFTLARVRLREGVFVDVYNLHAQAQVEPEDLAARRANLTQLIAHIDNNSSGNAVIVMGDTNTRYTRVGDTPRDFLAKGFSDVWVERVRGGDIPGLGQPALLCQPATTDPACEVVDKVFYRDNGFVGLTPTAYAIRTDAQNSAGEELSDHRPLEVQWTYQTPADRKMSDPWGGPHGRAFNDVSQVPSNPVVKTLILRAGSRVDRVETQLATGEVYSHGGSGGTQKTLALGSGESLQSLFICSGIKNWQTRIFYVKFTTSLGRTLSGGTPTATCTTFTAPTGFKIVAFHGRAGTEVDKLGVVYAQ